MSEPNSPGQPKASESNNPAGANDRTVQFDSTMSTKAGQPQDYFAEQNKEREEKRKKQKKTIAQSSIVIVTLLIVLLIIGVIIWLVLTPSSDTTTLPVTPVSIVDGSTAEVIAIQEQAQELYNLNPSTDFEEPNPEKIETVNQLFKEIENSEGGQRYHDQVLLAQVIFYVENNYYDQAKSALDKIDVEQLDKEQQALYYNYAGTISSKFGKNDKASTYYNEATKIRFELGGFGG